MENKIRQLTFPIEGMDCSDCALVVEHSLARLHGVRRVAVSFSNETVEIAFDSDQVSRRSIEQRIRHLGYSIPVWGLRKRITENRDLIASCLSGLALVLGWAGERWLGFPTAFNNILIFSSFLLAAIQPAKHAIRSLAQRQFDTDFLMLLAAIGAALIGEYAEGAFLLFLFSLGHALEEKTMDQTRKAIRSLAVLAPKTALVRRQDSETVLPIEALQIGDVTIVRPGARLPADGEVILGQSSVDQSPVTGESLPVEKSPGAPVFAGSINGESVLEVRVSRLAKDSTLARVVALVEAAQAQKSPTQRTMDRFIATFVPLVLIADLLLFIFLVFSGFPPAAAFHRAMVLLVAVSPCALALGTPAAVLSGIAQAARNGVLVKGGVHLENLGQLKALALDKTGTITRGTPELVEVFAIQPGGEIDLLALAAAVESRSNHPLAQAILRAAQDRGLDLPRVKEAIALNGLGFQAQVAGQTIRVGNLDLMNSAGIELPETLHEQVNWLLAQGKTVVFVSCDEAILGLLALADTIRSGVAEIIKKLKESGLRRIVMLTGDHAQAAGWIAQQAGLSNFYAGLLPENKLAVIEELLQEYRSVAMVGDGINDAPALARATVGIAMGGAGSDTALETADVALMADDLTRLPFAIRLGRATGQVIQQNLWISLGVIAGLSFLAASGLTSLGFAVLLHEGSTLLVVLNGLRLFRLKPG